MFDRAALDAEDGFDEWEWGRPPAPRGLWRDGEPRGETTGRDPVWGPYCTGCGGYVVAFGGATVFECGLLSEGKPGYHRCGWGVKGLFRSPP